MISAGELKHRLVLEAPVETPDGSGGVSRSYAPVATVWAALTATGDRADTSAGALGAVVTHRIVIRVGPEVTVRHRLRLGARIFRIVAVRADGDGQFLTIHAEERMD
jgi:SPP1 family predicted phage head-tail adaptor